ncbi:MAG: dTDP-4-dehydrorhamnose reductase [Verrucomicrobiota bacterium]|jgi:dTDP-4-dehydrorhamnose reductase
MKLVILGSNGRLGAALMRELKSQFELRGFNHVELDLANVGEIRAKIDILDFDVLINCAAMTNVDLCESEGDRAFRINAEAPRVLAEICARKNVKLIHLSTDYVFDGEKRKPYREDDAANPISVYGESKRAGEEAVLSVQDRHLVVRVSWVFGPDRPSFIDAIVKRAQENEQVEAIGDKFSTPTYTHDIAEMLPTVFSAEGILHLTNVGECSWQEYAQHALDCCHEFGVLLKAKTVAPLKLAEMKNFVARRPVYTVLATAKYTTLTGRTPRSWRDAVADYIKRSYSKT